MWGERRVGGMAGKAAAKVRMDAKAAIYAAPALDKGLDILELLARQTTGLTKSQLALELNRSVPEIFRMLVRLEGRGYISCGSDERYSLTLKLFRLAQEQPPTERLLAAALPVMKGLAHHTRQSCHLGVLEAGQVVILGQVNSPTNLGFYVRLGSVIELMESSTGYVILAHLPPEDRARAVAQWRRRSGKLPPRGLNSHLERLRRKGFEKRASYLVKGVVNISFPIAGAAGGSIAALTIPYIQHAHSTLSEEQITDALRVAAGEISEALGGHAQPS